MTTEYDDPLIEPIGQRQRLAALLGRLREPTGLNQTDFGGRAGMNQSKVSRLERGAQVPTVADAHAWADAAAATPDSRDLLLERVEAALTEVTSWADEVRRGLANKQRRIGRAERAASIVRVYTLIVPGLLQTAEYARRLFAMQAALQPQIFRDVPDGVAAWLERQLVLYQPGGRFEFVVGEAALRWRPGPDDDPRMLAAQMRHIAAVSTLDTVRLGVVPLGRPVGACPMHEFVVFGEPGVDEDVEVTVYTATRELHIRDADQVAVYLDLWKRLWDDAVFGDDARDLIGVIASELLAQ